MAAVPTWGAKWLRLGKEGAGSSGKQGNSVTLASSRHLIPFAAPHPNTTASTGDAGCSLAVTKP